MGCAASVGLAFFLDFDNQEKTISNYSTLPNLVPIAKAKKRETAEAAKESRPAQAIDVG